MRLRLVAVVAIFLVLAAGGGGAGAAPDHEWSYYGDDGPSFWAEWYPECNGTSQSPIDIRDVVVDDTLKPVSENYETFDTGVVSNNGHAIEIQFGDGDNLLGGGPLSPNGTYRLANVHFHAHSEHLINGTDFQFEAHLVHIEDTTGEIAVVGVLFEVGDSSDFLEPITNAMDQLMMPGNDTVLALSPAEFLPLAGREYFTYNGSLTTPPCSQGLTWIVMGKHLTLSQAQLDAFKLAFGAGVKPEENDRPVQPLNGRVVRHYIPDLPDSESSALLPAVALVVTLSVVGLSTLVFVFL